MKSLAIAVFYFLSINYAFADQINLICDLTYKDDNTTPQRIKTRIEVTSYKDGYVSIIPDSDLLSSVSTGNNPKTTSIKNYSNASKWHINRVGGSNANSGIADTTIIIDRNAGSISYSQIFSINGQSFNSSSFGYCEKINPNVKKF